MTRRRNDEEAELVRRCAEGDHRAWESFVDDYGRLIVALVRRMLARRIGSAHDADVDEIVADVFLALVRRDRVLLHRFDPTYRLSTYLGVICRTEVLRFLRRARRAPVGIEGAERVADAPDRGPQAVAADRERAEAVATLRDALAELSDRDRLLLSMRYLEGMDYRAIAAALDVNPESVGQFLTRAKARLARRVPHLERLLGAEE